MSSNGFGIHNGAVASVEEKSAPALTPSKQRYDLGAASSYYFKYVNSSSKKSAKKDQSFASVVHGIDNDDTADSSAMVGLDSLLGLSGDDVDDTDNGPDQSILSLGGRDRSMISLGASSTSSGSTDDNNLMNKSTLSDTTELTAANFVLTATSRQRLNLNNFAAAAKKNRQNQQTSSATSNSNSQKKDDILAGDSPSLDKENVVNLSFKSATLAQPLSKPSPKKGTPRKDSPNQHESPFPSISMLLPQSPTSPSPSSLRKSNDGLKNPAAESPDEKLEEPLSARRLSRSLSEKAPSPPLTQASPPLTLASTEKEPQGDRRASLESTVSGGRRSLNSTSTADESIASLGDFDDLFGDIVDETMNTHSHRRRSRRQSSLPARKSSVERLMNFDTDFSDSPPATASPASKGHSPASMEASSSPHLDSVASKNREQSPKKTILAEEFPSPLFSLTPSSHKKPTRSKLKPTPQRVLNVEAGQTQKETTLMDEIPSPPSTPRAKEPSLFRLTPSSHKKPAPTKLKPTPQRVPNIAAVAVAQESSMSDSSPTSAAGKSPENHVDSPSKYATDSAHSPENDASLSLQYPSEKNEPLHTPERVGQAKSEVTHRETPQESVSTMNEFSSPPDSIPLPSMRLTPNSHKKPTPTKLTKSPRRIVNPNALDSPARNTRRARKSILPMSAHEEEVDISMDTSVSTGGAHSPSLNLNDAIGRATPSGDLSLDTHTPPKDHVTESPAACLSPLQTEETRNEPQHRSTPNKPAKSCHSPSATDSYDGLGLSELLGCSSAQEEKFNEEAVSTPTKQDISLHSAHLRLTPNSHVKPTPTKLKPSPRRIPNPKALPKRSTRSSQKVSKRQSSGDTASVGMVEDLLGEFSESKRKRSEGAISVGALEDAFESLQKRHSSYRLSGSGMAGRTESRQLESPALQVKAQPISILSSRKRRSRDSGCPKVSQQRLVAFGSPEAAEYRIGSPSFSLTPMPKGFVRDKYKVPKEKELFQYNDKHTIELPRHLDSLSASKNGETVEIEADLNALVNNMQGSGNLSPIANVTEREATETFDMADSSNGLRPTNTSMSDQNDETVPLEGAIENVIAHSSVYPDGHEDSPKVNQKPMTGENYPVSRGSRSKETKLSMDLSSPSVHEESLDAFEFPSAKIFGPRNENVIQDQGEMTVELEPNVNALLQATQLGNSVVAPLHSPLGSTDESRSPDESVDMADTHSIASMSMNSRAEEPRSGTSPPIGAQKLDFRLHPSDNRDESMEVEFTVELENDMTSLLAAAGVAKACGSNMHLAAPPLNEMSMSTSTDSEFDKSSSLSPEDESDGIISPDDSSPNLQLDVGNEKRIAISRRSLSDSNMSSAMRSSSMTEPTLKSPIPETSKNDSSPSSASRSLNGSNVEAKIEPVETVTLTSDEILEAAGLSDVFTGKSIGGVDGLDPLLQISNSAREANNVLLLASLNQFITAVCGEIESQTETDADAASYFESSDEKDPSHLVGLQTSLRSSEEDEIRKEFIRMGDAVKVYAEADWNKWFSIVLKHLQQSVDGSSKNLNLDLTSLDSTSATNSEIYSHLSGLTEQLIRRLRWSAMARQKHALSSLEAEIRDMEAQLQDSKSSTTAAQAEVREIDYQIRSMVQSKSMKEEYISQRPLAESSQKKMISLKGLHSWNASSLEESTLSFCFSGHNPSTTIKMAFDLSDTGTVGCTASIEPRQLTRNHRAGRKYHSTVLAFLEVATKKLLGSCSLLSPEQIGPRLQQLELDMGRLAQIANEFESLRRRYNAKLGRIDEDTTKLLLSVNFLKQQKKVQATFEVLESYPSTSLPFTIDVLEGEVDVNDLRKMIARNVKPGFWSLSRACDAFVAFLGDRDR